MSVKKVDLEKTWLKWLPIIEKMQPNLYDKKYEIQDQMSISITWLFQQYGVDPVNVIVKLVKFKTCIKDCMASFEGFSAVVHTYYGQFHLNHHFFMNDAKEYAYKGFKYYNMEDYIEPKQEYFDVPDWELKTCTDTEILKPVKGFLKELIPIFNGRKKDAVLWMIDEQSGLVVNIKNDLI